jgi:hypothetical protein
MTRTLSRSILLLALGLPMAGCITTAEQVAQRNNERCAERGYQPKTDAFADCLVRLDSERDARLQARHREVTEKSGAPSLNRGY